MAESRVSLEVLPKMLFFLKLAAVTCAISIGITVLLFLVVIALVHWQGIVGLSHNFRAWAILFSVVWFASFTLAWRIVVSVYHN
jgi:hypothetical protein